MTDLDRIARQEEKLVFDSFDANTAWTLGTRLKEAVDAIGKSVAIDIQLYSQPLFFFAMPGTTPDNVEWARRKRNTTLRYHRSSYAIGLELKQQQTTLTEKAGVDARDYATHGGSFPLQIRGAGCIGAITVSGLPQRQDHSLIVSVLANLLGHPVDELALEN